MFKTKYQKLEKKLTHKRQFCFEQWTDKKKKQAFEFAENYKKFISENKIVRTRIKAGIKELEKNNFINFEDAKEKDLKNGKIYFLNRNKNLLAFNFSKNKDFKEGANLIFSHVDSPRLDLKQQPLLEAEKMAYLKTHYYGGIKKYQWVTLPLTISGTIVLENNKTIDLKIGDNENDPIFMITDLLPHLAKEQMEKPANKFIEAEKMHVLIGSNPINDEKIEQKVKLNILEILNKEYGITEEDFISAEIEIVPAGNARDLGFDRGFVAGYGHDDMVCSYAALKSFLKTKTQKKPLILFWCDKEEIGSVGNTSAESGFFQECFLRLLEALKQNSSTQKFLEICRKSHAISADVGVLMDPNHAEVFDVENTARAGAGVILEKHTGHGGKYNSSDANAEFVAKLRKTFNDAKIIWQTAAIGKIDIGGGGTLASYLSRFNMEIIDSGVGVFNMHAPWEIISKVDLFEMFEGYKVFYEKM